jgi:hypothetical protein
MDVVDLQIYLMTARNFFAQREATDDVVLYVEGRIRVYFTLFFTKKLIPGFVL